MPRLELFIFLFFFQWFACTCWQCWSRLRRLWRLHRRLWSLWMVYWPPGFNWLSPLNNLSMTVLFTSIYVKCLYYWCISSVGIKLRFPLRYWWLFLSLNEKSFQNFLFKNLKSCIFLHSEVHFSITVISKLCNIFLNFQDFWWNLGNLI